MITGEHHNLFETGAPQRSQCQGCIRPNGIFQDQSAFHDAVYRYEGAGRSFQQRATMQTAEGRGRRAALKQPLAFAQRDVQPVYPAPDTRTVFFRHAAWKPEFQLSFRRPP